MSRATVAAGSGERVGLAAMQDPLYNPLPKKPVRMNIQAAQSSQEWEEDR